MSNFEFKKKFGQNFLSDENLLAEIVEKAGVMCDDVVLEIGAGKGALTTWLSKNAKIVHSFEIDKELVPFLNEKFTGTNVVLHYADIMKIDDFDINNIVGGNFKLVANLPYYITSPIITRFLQNENLQSLTVMVQEEVADRIVAKPKSKDYGVLSVICQIFGTPQKVLRVNRKMFYPIPNVDSAVVRIDRKDVNIKDSAKFIEFVKKAFSMRRKKFSSNLENEKLTKAVIESTLEQLGFSSLARAEEFSVDELYEIYKTLLKCGL